MSAPSTGRWPAVAIVAAALVIAAIAVPVAGAFLSQSAETDQTLATLEGYRAKIASTPRLKAQAIAIAQQEADAGMLIAGGSTALAAAAVQNTILDIVQRHGGQVRSSQVLSSKNATGLIRIEMQYEVSLPPGSLMVTTYELENSKPYLFIDATEIRPELYGDASTAAPTALHTSWTIHAYQKAAAR